jgi:hypothetical protein
LPLAFAAANRHCVPISAGLDTAKRTGLCNFFIRIQSIHKTDSEYFLRRPRLFWGLQDPENPMPNVHISVRSVHCIEKAPTRCCNISRRYNTDSSLRALPSNTTTEY